MSQPQTIYRHDYQPPAYLVEQAELTFDLAPAATRVTSRLQMRRNPEGSGGPLRLDGEQLGLLSLRLDGQIVDPADYQLDQKSLVLPQVPQTFCLETEVEIAPAANTALEGLYLSNGTYCTQCEAEGFRRITFFPDRPDLLARFTTRVIGDRQDLPLLLANGNPTSREELPDGRHSVTWEDPFPKPCYLFALVAGDLAEISDSFVTASGREVALRFYVEQQHREKAGHAMLALKKAMRWDEEQFGREYDLAIYMVVAVDDFNMGAMENKGLNVFNSKYVLACPETATDADYQAIEEVIAHEYFHNWTGNRITCRDWFQLSLKEGLTVFRDQEFSADQVHRAAKRIEDVRLLRNSQFPEDAGPMAHPVRPDSYQTINNFYTMTIYHKGAELIRMYRALLGENGFRRGMDLYFTRHDGQAVTCDDFRQAMADASGTDLQQFENWYSQAGTPKLEIRADYTASRGEYRLQVRQSCRPTPGQAEKKPFPIPLRLALLNPEGEPQRLRRIGAEDGSETEQTLLIDSSEQSFTFIGLEQEPIPSLLRGFSAPVILDYPYSETELARLLALDSDPFSRWEAGQKLFLGQLQQLIGCWQTGAPLTCHPNLVEACQKVLTDPDCDPALRCQLLTLPTETYLAEQMETADPDAIHACREYLLTELAEQLEADLQSQYQQLQSQAPFSYSATAAGRRSLKNICLDLLARSRSEAAVQLCFEQFKRADNMSDSIAALRSLVESGAPLASDALQAFYERWQHEPLVIDKWFGLQATSGRPGTLARVEELRRHPAFTLKNPNRARALLGAFAHGNQVAFHQADGAGYHFVAGAVLELDRLNPQISARLATSFNRWRRFDGQRQELIQKELQELLRQPGISTDLKEILSKSLA